jgi:diguanylate cyclase (GGDEF)-like protein
MGSNLKEVSDKTISEVIQQDVVLPSQYTETFQHNAQTLGIEVELEELVKSLATDDLEHAKQMIAAANNHLETLHTKANDATDAIAKKDDKKLNEISSDIQKMKQEIATLREQLYTDSLTKVKNRKWMSENYVNPDGLVTKQGVMVFMDLNFFKSINDTYGHLVGDKVLIFFAGFFKKTVGSEGYEIVRYAGDEFIAFLDHASDEDPVKEKFANLQKAMIRKKLKAPSGEILTVSFSYGVESFTQGANFREVLESADKKMYENKQYIKSVMHKN